VRITRTDHGLDLEFQTGEVRGFQEIIKFHAQMPALKRPLTKSGKVADGEAGQRLLDDALAQHRAANRKRATGWLDDPVRLQRTETGARLALSFGEVESLLQILNDLRVGCWVALGSPDEFVPPADEGRALHFALMMMSGALEVQLLEALEEEQPPTAPSHDC